MSDEPFVSIAANLAHMLYARVILDTFEQTCPERKDKDPHLDDLFSDDACCEA